MTDPKAQAALEQAAARITEAANRIISNVRCDSSYPVVGLSEPWVAAQIESVVVTLREALVRSQEALTDILSRFGDDDAIRALVPEGAEAVRSWPMDKAPKVAEVQRWRAALAEREGAEGHKCRGIFDKCDTCGKPMHVCGLAGYNPMIDPMCPACAARGAEGSR